MQQKQQTLFLVISAVSCTSQPPQVSTPLTVLWSITTDDDTDNASNLQRTSLSWSKSWGYMTTEGLNRALRLHQLWASIQCYSNGRLLHWKSR